jgi:hypothetical protein
MADSVSYYVKTSREKTPPTPKVETARHLAKRASANGKAELIQRQTLSGRTSERVIETYVNGQKKVG